MLRVLQRASVGAIRGFRTSAVALEVFQQKVPSMGDSISEGTIETVLKAPGDAVAADEELVTIETDKVTIDVRAEAGGSIVAVHVAEGDEVEVGAALVTIDTEGEAAPQPAAEEAPAAAPEEPAPATAAPAAPATPATPATPAPAAPRGARQPLIRFRHGKANREALERESSSSGAAAAAAAPSWDSGDWVDPDMDEFDPWQGRPVLSEAEMDAIMSGGATEVQWTGRN